MEAGPTALDPSVANGLTTIDGTSITIASTGATLSDVAIASATDGPAGILSPPGIISYKTTAPIGGSVTVRFDFSIPLPSNLDIYKVDNAGIFKKLPPSIWTRVGTGIIDITLIDGDPLTDLDLTANGQIVDPIALADSGATITASPNSESGGGGCSLGPASTFDPQLIIMLMAALLYLSRRHPLSA